MSSHDPFVNLDKLRKNSYPGRGFVIGLNSTGDKVVQVPWIMGRGENSRNRVYRQAGGCLFTRAADPAKMKDPTNVIYNAMWEGGNYSVVSNGDQTDAVANALVSESALGRPLPTLRTILKNWQFEDDTPIFTPRITGLCQVRDNGCFIELALLRRCDLIAGGCLRFYYEYDGLVPGVGFCLTTYMEDGDPPPHFIGEPYPMPLMGTASEIAAVYWRALNEDNRVALAVKMIDLKTKKSEITITNRFSPVSSE